MYALVWVFNAGVMFRYFIQFHLVLAKRIALCNSLSMSRRQSSATERALRLVARGMKPSEAARRTGIAYTTIWRALKAQAAATAAPVAPVAPGSP